MIARARAASGLELALGATIVVGHNVFHAIPNEVPILAVLGLASLWWRDGGLAAIGLVRPPSWRRILAIAIAAAAVRIALGELVVDPLVTRYWPPAQAPAAAASIAGDPARAALLLPVIWVFAAFGEELVYRGYLLARAAQLGGDSRRARWIAMIVVAVLFGIGHAYKGPAGMIDSGVAGLILGAAYLAAGRNLWASILAHGLIDTVALAVAYLG